VIDDPLSAYNDSTLSEEVWFSTSYGFHDTNKFHLNAYRDFENTDDHRDFKLGTYRKFTVGWYDYATDAGGWTD
jgi:hypothetical protein